mmetsp:Transcript_48408/g.135235  ORF Transcript_48408/g.135235 Transcript_48408/m.135235 type:complete len:301 (+) Transcript_48408:112-1014(+)
MAAACAASAATCCWRNALRSSLRALRAWSRRKSSARSSFVWRVVAAAAATWQATSAAATSWMAVVAQSRRVSCKAGSTFSPNSNASVAAAVLTSSERTASMRAAAACSADRTPISNSDTHTSKESLLSSTRRRRHFNCCAACSSAAASAAAFSCWVSFTLCSNRAHRHAAAEALAFAAAATSPTERASDSRTTSSISSAFCNCIVSAASAVSAWRIAVSSFRAATIRLASAIRRSFNSVKSLAVRAAPAEVSAGCFWAGPLAIDEEGALRCAFAYACRAVLGPRSFDGALRPPVPRLALL